MSTADSPKRHVSELPDPRLRFLSRVLDQSLQDAWRSASDFLRHFPPSTIMESLAGADALRVRLLVTTTGTHERIALKKSIASATEDLDIALSEKTATPESLLALYPADDKVRLLEARKLWRFAVEDEFYKVTATEDATRHARAAERLTFVVECAIDEGLITLKDVADGITFEEIAQALPVHDVREIVKHALQIGRAGAPLTEERFLAVVPLASLVSRVKLEYVWQRVVLERVAGPADFAEVTMSSAPQNEEIPSAVDVMSIREPELPPVPEIAVAAGASTGGATGSTTETSGGIEDDEIRRKLIERLRVIDRLPPSYMDIATPILLSVESMYADLWAVSDDDEREACIRESFPNDSHLRAAMLALIELLDPSVDTHDPIIRDADVSGLVKIVLFEERRRRDAGPGSKRAQSSAPSNKSRRSVPPPLPRSNTPPPLPAVDGRSVPPPLPEMAASKRDR